MRRERNAAKALWLANIVMVGILAWMLHGYFSTRSLPARDIPVYHSPMDEDRGEREDPVESFPEYHALQTYFPKNVIYKPQPKPEPGLDKYIEVLKVFPGNGACKLRQKVNFPGSRRSTKSIYYKGDELSDGITSVKEIRKDGVLFARKDRKDVFLPVTTE